MAKEKLQGNQNARKGVHDGPVIRLDVPVADLIYEFLALEGNADPSRAQIKAAVQSAIRQVYGRRMEDQHAIIV